MTETKEAQNPAGFIPEPRVEPSFDFAYGEESSVFRNALNRGIDISLYHGKKLCLSPNGHHKPTALEGITNRNVDKMLVSPIFTRAVKAVVDANPGFSVIYHVLEAQEGSYGFDYFAFNNRELRDDKSSVRDYSELFLQDKKGKLLPEIMRRFWARYHPLSIDVDGLRGNDLRIYLLDSEGCAKLWSLVRKTTLRDFMQEDEAPLRALPKLAISNLNHGYRARITRKDKGSFEEMFDIAALVKRSI